MTARDVLRRMIPFPIRLELLRLRRLPGWILEAPSMARRIVPPAQRTLYDHVLAQRSSPLRRESGHVDPVLQEGKEHNVTLAASRLDGLVIQPNQVFSYHHVIGRPTGRDGFRIGLELHNGEPSSGIGGGCCQVSNLLYLLALESGMKVVERHRHGLDLFPDHERTVPFGCGATVFYNYADLRFENPLATPVLLNCFVQDGRLHAAMLTTDRTQWTVELYEVDHRFFREGPTLWRENRIRRRFRMTDGSVLLDQEVAHNRGRVLYEPKNSDKAV